MKSRLTEGPNAMTLGAATMFNYCERGLNPAFWAEPINAVTNAAFILAALGGLVLLRKQPVAERSAWSYFFIANLTTIGVGSFLFHTVPNRVTVLADVIPIGIFMLAYLLFTARRFLGFGIFGSSAAVAGFVGLAVLAMNVRCWDGRIGFLEGIPAGAKAVCLNGSLEYGPALLTLWLVSGWMVLRRHPAVAHILAASAVFLASVTLRSVDFTLCGTIAVGAYPIGTHFLWHLLNAVTLFLLIAAAIFHGGTGTVTILPPRPKARSASYGVP